MSEQEIRLPTSTIASAHWTMSPAVAAHLNVNDAVGSPDGDTTRMFADGLLQGFLDAVFGGAAFTVPENAQNIAVHIAANAKRVNYSAGAEATINGLLDIGGTYYVGTAVNLTANYADYGFTFSVNPETTSAWTAAEVNGLTGFGIRAYSSYVFGGAYNQPVVTQVYAYVTWDDPASGYAMAGIGVLVGGKSASAG